VVGHKFLCRGTLPRSIGASPGSTSGSRTSETGGAKFVPKFFNDFFRSFPRKFLHFPQKFHLSPKISDDLFLSSTFFVFYIWYFSIGWAKSAADFDTGGAKLLTFQQNHNTSIALSVPQGGQTPLRISMKGGHGRICSPGSATTRVHSRNIVLPVFDLFSNSVHRIIALDCTLDCSWAGAGT